jgi:hypothetical protein
MKPSRAVGSCLAVISLALAACQGPAPSTVTSLTAIAPTPVTSANSAAGAPAVPTHLDAQKQANGDILLRWDPVQGATEIHVERRDGPDAKFLELGVTGPGSSGHLNTGLKAGTQYTWRLKACNAAGCSDYSAEAVGNT